VILASQTHRPVVHLAVWINFLQPVQIAGDLVPILRMALFAKMYHQHDAGYQWPLGVWFQLHQLLTYGQLTFLHRFVCAFCNVWVLLCVCMYMHGVM
jgi:hypothetical protein